MRPSCFHAELKLFEGKQKYVRTLLSRKMEYQCRRPGGGDLPNMSYIAICGPRGYGSLTLLVRNTIGYQFGRFDLK